MKFRAKYTQRSFTEYYTVEAKSEEAEIGILLLEVPESHEDHWELSEVSDINGVTYIGCAYHDYHR